MKLQLFALLSIILCTNAAYPKLSLPNPRYLFGGRIVGGIAVDIKEHPHQVSLQTSGHFCGGSIISKDYVLTAGHCAEGQSASRLKVRVGSSFKSKDGDLVTVEEITVHPSYNPFTIDYDFALLKLSESLDLGENVKAIKLPEQDKSPSAGTHCTVSGWGNTLKPNESTAQLRAVTVPIVDQDACNKAYGDFYSITPRMICAGYEEGGKDSCQGDSGGPLSSNGVLVGVVSWGKGCALQNYPGVYARVAAARNWIKENSGV